MAEKRFTLTDWHEVKDKDKVMTVDEVIDTLNSQAEKIEHLQKIIKLTSYQLQVQDRILKEVGE